MGILRIAARTSLAVVLLSATLFATGFEISGVGVKARALGGAFRAVADDWTAAYYNPAGYALLKDNEWGSNLALVNYRDDIAPNYGFGSVEVGTGFNGTALYNKYAVLSNPSFGVVSRVPIWGETVLGFSIYQPFDQNIGWQLYRQPEAYNDSLTAPSNQFSSNLDVVAFQLTLAREFSPKKLSVGLGLQLLRSDLVYHDVMFRPTPMTTSPYTDNPYNRIPEFTALDGNGWGFGIKLGALYKVTEKMNLGLSFSLPFNMTIKGNANLAYFLPKIGGVYRYEVRQGTVDYLFAAGHSVELSPEFETTLKLPPSFGAGLSYLVNEKLTLSLDAEYTMWSRFDGFSLAFSKYGKYTEAAADTMKAFFEQDQPANLEWKNAFKAALGGQYEVNNILTLLGGLSYDQGTNPDKVGYSPQYIDAGSKIGFSGGSMLHFKTWDVGVSGSIVTQSDVTATQQYNSDGSLRGLAGDYKATTLEMVFSIRHRF